jgi:hypothetical protein
MFWRNIFIMCFILSPVIVLFGMIIFAGKPKDQIEREKAKAESED